MIPKYDEEDFINNLTNPIYSIMQETQYQVLSVITNRIRSIGKLSATDAHRLSQLIRMEDLDTIESIIAAGTNLSAKEVNSIIEQAATNNDNLAENLYKYRGIEQGTYLTDASLISLVKQSKKSIIDNIVNLSKTTSFMVNGKVTDIAKTYNYAINKAVFEVQQGLFDYNTVMRSTITQLASSGLRTVDYASGYSRRLDSSVRQNLSDGIRQMNIAYRDVQSNQYGGNHVFISLHGLCAEDHLHINGKDYTEKEWERISSGLLRQVGTMNCRHYITKGITGISNNPYSDKERAEAIQNSTKQVEYSTLQKDSDGKTIKNSLSRYDASQKLRQVETNIRQLKDVRNQLSLNNDTVGVAEYNKKIKAKTVYYKKIANEIGLKPQLDRLRVYNPK